MLGHTTIGEARKLIKDKYGQHFNIDWLEPNKYEPLSTVIAITEKDKSYYILVILNEWATVLQNNTSVVHEIKLYAYSETNQDTYVPTVVDMLLKFGKPGCLAPQLGNHAAWPTMLYPQYQVKLSFGKDDFKVTPYLPAGLILTDEPIKCDKSGINWRGFETNYRSQFLASMQP